MEIEQLFSQYGGKAVEALVKPVSDKLNSQIDKMAIQARSKIASERKVPQSSVSDLEVAEYISGIPTALMTKEIGTEMQYIGQSTRNGLVIGLGIIALAILIVGLNKKKA